MKRRPLPPSIFGNLFESLKYSLSLQGTSQCLPLDHLAAHSHLFIRLPLHCIKPGGRRVKKLSLFGRGGVDMGISTWWWQSFYQFHIGMTLVGPNRQESSVVHRYKYSSKRVSYGMSLLFIYIGYTHYKIKLFRIINLFDIVQLVRINFSRFANQLPRTPETTNAS